MSLLQNAIAFVGSIGADPSDSEQVRLLKRIWTITLALAVPLTAGMALTYQLMGQWPPAVFWLIHVVVWTGSLFLFAVVRNNIEGFALSSQAFLVLSSFIITCLLGGFFRSDGVIFMGLIGVLYAMVFPSRRRALFLFLLYISLFSVALILELTVFRSDAVQPPVSTLFFWITFALVAAFTVFLMLVGRLGEVPLAATRLGRTTCSSRAKASGSRKNSL